MRPDRWKAPEHLTIKENEMYEKGADDMLKGLREWLQDVCFESEIFTGLSYADYKSVFIEEE